MWGLADIPAAVHVHRKKHTISFFCCPAIEPLPSELVVHGWAGLHPGMHVHCKTKAGILCSEFGNIISHVHAREYYLVPTCRLRVGSEPVVHTLMAQKYESISIWMEQGLTSEYQGILVGQSTKKWECCQQVCQSTSDSFNALTVDNHHSPIQQFHENSVCIICHGTHVCL